MKLFLISLVALPLSLQAGAHWGYSGEVSPEHWSELDPAYSSCAGKNQSPIDLHRFVEAELPPLTIAYQPAGGDEILNNGHTVQINDHSHGYIEVDGQKFELVQFHFHSPSENHLNGRSFPMEAHFVHVNENGELAVIAVFFEEGAENEALQAAWQAMPMHAGEKHALSHAVSAMAVLPKNKEYYRFNGSLTTPPCTEGVRWLVMKETVSLSKEQLEKFAHHALHEPNNRPVQALNARVVLQ